MEEMTVYDAFKIVSACVHKRVAHLNIKAEDYLDRDFSSDVHCDRTLAQLNRDEANRLCRALSLLRECSNVSS